MPAQAVRHEPGDARDDAASGEWRSVERLLRVGMDDGPSLEDALVAFRYLRSTPNEGRAIDALLARGAERPLPEPLVAAIAGALVDRGERPAALRSLAGATSSPALLLSADLRSEEGDFATALALAERVLLRDFDHPGARERHVRWREALGFDDARARVIETQGVTVVASEPDAPFRLLREVARGGSGAVYEAEDRELRRRVALKVYHHPDRDRAQLVHEAHVASELAGANVVRIFDVDPDHGWLALEWASLGALRDHIRAKDRAALLPIERWALPLASALARVHAAGWAHNDVKPANVLLRSFETPLLSDFGTARRLGEPSPPGSLGYVSPERLAGRASDAKDDVYGFGRILEDVLDVLDAHANAEAGAIFRAVAAACTGPDAHRPENARALVTRLKVEAPHDATLR